MAAPHRKLLVAGILIASVASPDARAGEYDLPMADEISDRFSDKPLPQYEAPPLVDFAFSFSRYVGGQLIRNSLDLHTGIHYRIVSPPDSRVANTLRDDKLLTELEAAEAAVAEDFAVDDQKIRARISMQSPPATPCVNTDASPLPPPSRDRVLPATPSTNVPSPTPVESLISGGFPSGIGRVSAKSAYPGFAERRWPIAEDGVSEEELDRRPNTDKRRKAIGGVAMRFRDEFTFASGVTYSR